MKRQHVLPNVITYSPLISGCEAGNRPTQSFDAFRLLQRQGVLPDVVTYGALINAYTKDHHAGRAFEIF